MRDSDTSAHDASHRSRGFTMIEVLVVCIVLGVIAGVAVPQYLTHRTKSRIASVATDARNTGAMIEGAFEKERLYPPTLDAVGSQVPEIRLSTGNEVAQYTVVDSQGVVVAPPAVGTGFRICIIHRTGTTIDAYGLYDSTKGGLIGKGSGEGPTTGPTAGNCTPTADPAPVGPTAPPPTGGPTSPPPTGGPVDPDPASATPENVTVNAVAGETKATVSWDEFPDATAYSVYLDGSATPAWTGPDLTTVLTGLGLGGHDVTVSAKVGGEDTDKSEAVLFTIYGDNDKYAQAHPVKITGPNDTWTSRDYDNTNATINESPLNGNGDLWWTFTAPDTTGYWFQGVAATDGTIFNANPAVEVYTNAPTVATTARITYSNSAKGAWINGVAGTTYKVRVMLPYASPRGKFRFRAIAAPSNDAYSQAQTAYLSGPDDTWTSGDFDNTYATTESPLNGNNDLWWTFTAPATTGYWFQGVEATDGTIFNANPAVEVYTGAATVATTTRISYSNSAAGATVNGVAGTTYKIRVLLPYSSPMGKFRFRATAAPVNDNYLVSTPIGSTSGAPWTSTDYTNKFATEESPFNGTKDLWWTFTAPATKGYWFQGIPAVDGTIFHANPAMETYTDAATNATATRIGYANQSISLNAVAGTTYKVRVALPYGSGTGKFRLRAIEGPDNDNYLMGAAVGSIAGGTWTSEDQNNTYATEESPFGGTKDVWWTFTAAASGNTTFEAIPASDGTIFHANPAMEIYTNAATNAGATRLTYANRTLTYNVVAGTTYKIRVTLPYASGTGKFRLKVTKP